MGDIVIPPALGAPSEGERVLVKLEKRPIVTIDGPAGAGKSTVAKLVAKALEFVCLDTGAMYRAVALAATRDGIGLDDVAALEKLAYGLQFRFETNRLQQRFLVNGVELGAALRTPEISNAASRIARHQPVTQALVYQTKILGQNGRVVVDGRNGGTLVFPDALVKIYLTASSQIRAQRRMAEYRQVCQRPDFSQLLADIDRRDHDDMCRAYGPLAMADDAIEIVSDRLTIEDVCQNIVAVAAYRLSHLV